MKFLKVELLEKYPTKTSVPGSALPSEAHAARGPLAPRSAARSAALTGISAKIGKTEHFVSYLEHLQPFF